jgi:hypothetical protein
MVNGTRIDTIYLNGSQINNVYAQDVHVFESIIDPFTNPVLQKLTSGGVLTGWRMSIGPYDDESIRPFLLVLEIRFSTSNYYDSVHLTGIGQWGNTVTPVVSFMINTVTFYAGLNYDASGPWIGIYSDAQKNNSFNLNQSPLLSNLNAYIQTSKIVVV